MTNISASSARPRIDFDVVVLDTDDPQQLADFYTALLGWRVQDAEDGWITITGDSGARVAFQRATDYMPPTWPDNHIPQQFHLDLRVSDLEEAGAYAESVGARRVANQGVEGDFVVYLDPSGHPFCLCREG